MKLANGWNWPRIARRNFLRLAGVTALTGISAVRAADQPPPASAPAVATPRIWTSFFAVKTVWGYVDRHSVIVGEPFDAMLSTGPSRETVSGRVEFFRVGGQASESQASESQASGNQASGNQASGNQASGNQASPGLAEQQGQTLIWTSPEVTVTPREVSLTAAAVGAGWPPALRDVATGSWPAGYYSADFVHAATGVRDRQVAQIVVRDDLTKSDPAKSRVLLKLGSNTYQAYNAWGGHSLYPSEIESQRGVMVSFDRPTEPAFFEYEVYLARWLEALAARHGFAVDYATDFDVHHDPSLLDRYALVISGSHDEYWSKETFDAFERRIFAQGRNVIFAGANAAYFQVRYADVNRAPGGADFGRQLVCYKSLNDPIMRRRGNVDPTLLATARFRDETRRPESMLMGTAFQSWFSPDGAGPRYPYVVASTNAPFFAGLDWKAGDAIADVVGYEWDNRDPDGDGHSLWDRERSRIGLLPRESVKVLFRGEPIDAEGAKGLAEAVYFRSPAGGKVFSAGSIRWAWGLGKPGFEREAFRQFNANLVLDFLR